jgi:hypothetical protein
MSETVSFSDLLKTKADSHTRPKALPAGYYVFLVKGQVFGKSSQKQTPFCEYDCWITQPCEDIPESELEGVDLSSRHYPRTFYLTGPAMWRLTDFLEKCGLDTQRAFEEIIPEAVGCQFKGYLNQRPSREPGSDAVFNEITSTVEL